MFAYAKCTGSPWLLQIQAEENEDKGEPRIERSFTGCLFLTSELMITVVLFDSVFFFFLTHLAAGNTALHSFDYS